MSEILGKQHGAGKWDCVQVVLCEAMAYRPAGVIAQMLSNDDDRPSNAALILEVPL
ncbi:MAG: hypothetical protein M0Z26_10360 [Acidithiobacillus sp.]|jgi:hypothetical protein|nr:hypothetical protein [Acidithiobacillus sp.]